LKSSLEVDVRLGGGLENETGWLESVRWRRHGLRKRRRDPRGRAGAAMSSGGRHPWLDLLDPDAIEERTTAVSLCRGVFGGASVPTRSLVVGVGETSTTMVFAAGERPVAFWKVRHERTAQATVHAAEARLGREEAAASVRAAARVALERVHLSALRGFGCHVVGASRLARAIVTMSADGADRASLEEVSRATNQLLARSIESRIRGFPGDWVRAFAVGAAVLEAAMLELGASSVWGPAALYPDSTWRRRSTIVRT
jgi:hypothetical protein